MPGYKKVRFLVQKNPVYVFCVLFLGFKNDIDKIL